MQPPQAIAVQRRALGAGVDVGGRGSRLLGCQVTGVERRLTGSLTIPRPMITRCRALVGAGLGVAGLAQDSDWFKPDTGIELPDFSSAVQTYNPAKFARYDVADIGGGLSDLGQVFDTGSEITAGLTDIGTDDSWWKKLLGLDGGGGSSMYDSVVGDALQYVGVGQY